MVTRRGRVTGDEIPDLRLQFKSTGLAAGDTVDTAIAAGRKRNTHTARVEDILPPKKDHSDTVAACHGHQSEKHGIQVGRVLLGQPLKTT